MRFVVSVLLFISVIYGQNSIDEKFDVKLGSLVGAAKQANSSALVIYRDGELIIEEYFGGKEKPIETMSALKSIISIAVGKLLTDGYLDSLTTPVYEFYPEWKQGNKKNITVLHLLNHTSGLQNVPSAGVEIYPAPDAIRLALAAELSDKPGEKFSYNNKAVNLLAGIIEKAAGLRMDEFVKEELFKPMNITQYKWYYDEAGNPHAMAGLQLTAKDLAKFGLLVLNKGLWNNEQLIDSNYITAMTNTAQAYYPFCGLLWWLKPDYVEYILTEEKLNSFREKGVSEEFITKLLPYLDTTIPGRADRNNTFEKAFGEKWYVVREEEFFAKGVNSIFGISYGTIAAYYAEGYLGQYLVVVPESGIVAVRQVERTENYNPETDTFKSFIDLAAGLK